MAKIEDLIAQIPDERLRKGIAAEVKALKKTKKFGLVFEEHLPETVRLPKLPVKPGEVVALKRESGNQIWRVKSIHKNVATCDRAVVGYPASGESNQEFPVSDLVVVRSFGDPIYPALVPVDRVARGGPDKPWHMLINADNFHALQLLLYAYESKVDVIYIDPPYNTGARDWKYNNDYVDKSDSFRHSKWLSMMKKRLLLAKRLLKADGVLIVTIDDNELSHLAVLLDDILPSYEQQIATIVINPGGSFGNNLSSVHEYAVFCIPSGKDLLKGRALTAAELAAYSRKDSEGNYDIERLWKRGIESLRADRVSMFYAVFVDEKTLLPLAVGPEMKLDEKPVTSAKEGRLPVFPIDEKGVERRWGCGRDTMLREIESGNIIAERDRNGMVKLYKKARPKNSRRLNTVWTNSEYSAGDYGSRLVNSILGKANAFPFPKSLYAVRDTIASVCQSRPNALVLDFFSGSGTTFHAVALLNAEDGGSRRSILVTNNEVAEKRASELHAKEVFPGSTNFEEDGIAESVTWPRCKYVVEGRREDGSEIPGTYSDGRKLSSGFDENLEYYRLDFLDPDEVARGDAFKAIVPILWMVAGCLGEREDSKGSTPWFIPKHSPFAVLIQEKQFCGFREKLAERKDIEWVFLITDSEENFGQMRRTLGRKYECVQLYKSYLENFRINTQDALNG